MSSTTFTDYVTPVPASWLNDVNKTIYTKGEYYTDAGGTSDSITASYTVATTDATIYDGFRVTLGIVTPNTTTTPTLAITLNGVAQGAKTIVKFVGNTEVALAIGDLQGDVDLRYDLPNTVWILMNPALAPTIHGATSKATPVDADELPITDSAASFGLKRLTWANLKATAKTYFDTLYAALSGATFTGLVNLATGANIASAATLNLSTATGNTVHVTGTTGTTAVTMTSGQWMECIADGAWPLTWHATNLNLNTGGASYTCAAGDRIFFFFDGTTVYGNIIKANGAPASGSIVGISGTLAQFNTACSDADFIATTTAWTDYTTSSTVTGWSSFTTKKIFYQDTGKIRTVWFYLEGTSNATTTSFTMPSAAINSGMDFESLSFKGRDNTIWFSYGPGLISMPANSATVNLYSSNSGTGWTASGTKTAVGQFSYQLP